MLVILFGHSKFSTLRSATLNLAQEGKTGKEEPEHNM
jgi:hypothetical protein